MAALFYGYFWPRLQLLYTAVMAAVGEVNHQADDQPDDQAGPVHPAELVHHVAVEEDARELVLRAPTGCGKAAADWDWCCAAS